MTKAVCFAFISFSPTRGVARRQRKEGNISSSSSTRSNRKVIKCWSMKMAQLDSLLLHHLLGASFWWKAKAFGINRVSHEKNFTKPSSDEQQTRNALSVFTNPFVTATRVLVTWRKVFISNAISRCAIKTRGCALGDHLWVEIWVSRLKMLELSLWLSCSH